jgi:glycogen operon protein
MVTGAEGETDDPDVLALRARQQRNLLTTLLLSQGTPMPLGGDELGRSQGGNNNGWCQDNDLSWLDWNDVDRELDTDPRSAELATGPADDARPIAPGSPLVVESRSILILRRG